MDMELGVIEGFYGKPWSWQEREDNVTFLVDRGFGFYIYAPKSDPYLRRRWKEPHPEAEAAQLVHLAAHCRELHVAFGVGLSPYDAFLEFDDVARAALSRKLAFFDDSGVEYLAILFDDMRGDVPQLAGRQIEIVHWAAERTSAQRIIVCPTYYSDDPILDRVFGQRPENYLEQLGEMLDPSIELFWTGEEVCSREITPGHLERVVETIGRKPFLWDNYPVNDGQRMSQYLHVRGFTGRPALNADYITAHGINPALQPVLTRVPILTLIDCYRCEEFYEYRAAQRHAENEALGPELGRLVHEDTLIVQDIGLDRLGDRAQTLRERYGTIDHPAAREIIAWLDGAYRITDADVQAQ